MRQLLELPNAKELFPEDAIARARKYLDAIATTGAYTESQGALVFREEIAQAIKARPPAPGSLSTALMRLACLLHSSWHRYALGAVAARDRRG